MSNVQPKTNFTADKKEQVNLTCHSSYSRLAKNLSKPEMNDKSRELNATAASGSFPFRRKQIDASPQ